MTGEPGARTPAGPEGDVGSPSIGPRAWLAIESPSARDRSWDKDYESWRRSRLDRVQASARVWLGALTTVLGLLGSVVLIKGGNLVGGVTTSGWFQGILIGLVALALAAAIPSVIAAGMATWGGIEDIVPADEAAARAASRSEHTDQQEGAGLSAESPWWDLIKRRALRGMLKLAGISRHERDRILPLPGQPPARELTSAAESAPQAPDWQRYRDDIIRNADRNRIYLHASRVLGVVAAVMIACLAVVAVIAGTIYPTPAMVVVVKHGRVSCGPVGKYAKDTGVTQVISVPNC